MLNMAALKQTHFKGGRFLRIMCVFAFLNKEMITQLENKEEQSSDLITIVSYPHLKCSKGCLETPKYKL